MTYPSLKDWASCLIDMRQPYDWSDHVSTGVYSVRVSLGQGEMLEDIGLGFHPTIQQHVLAPRVFYPTVGFPSEPPKLNLKHARCEHLYA